MSVKGIIYGVGINDAPYQISIKEWIDGKLKETWRCPYYITWNDMIRRCYSEAFKIKKLGHYDNTTICEEWKTFSVFREWMSSQTWEIAGKKLQIDKDLIGGGIYSPETCLFVTAQTNSFLVEADRARGECKIGVIRKGGRFYAQCNDSKKKRQVYLGYFDKEEDAFDAYKKAKYGYMLRLCEEQTDVRVVEALHNYYKDYKEAYYK